MMNHERYDVIRKRLCILFAIITKRTFPVWVYPAHLMTTDEIRERGEYNSFDTIPDSDIMSNPVCRKLTIPAIIELLPNVTPDQPLSVQDAHKNLIQIYESVQEYNALWYELYLTGSNFGSINPREIEYLERISYYFYNEYARIRLYLDNSERRKKVKGVTQGSGLAGMLGMLTVDSKLGKGEKIEFISYYDLLTTKVLPNFNQSMPSDAYVPMASDTLMRRKEVQEQFGIWGQ